MRQNPEEVVKGNTVGYFMVVAVMAIGLIVVLLSPNNPLTHWVLVLLRSIGLLNGLK